MCISLTSVSENQYLIINTKLGNLRRQVISQVSYLAVVQKTDFREFGIVDFLYQYMINGFHE